MTCWPIRPEGSTLTQSAKEIIALLKLEPHPEGGWFRQSFVDEEADGGRARSTAIYYLLEGDDVSAWHRVDAAEVWHWYAGAPLRLRMSKDGHSVSETTLGSDIGSGQRPQGIVPAKCWQSATSEGDWTLVGCTVAPGFLFLGFEIAPPGWEPS